MSRTTRTRSCVRCGELYPEPYPWPHRWPRQFCSDACHRKRDAPAPTVKRRSVSEASREQRQAVRERACIVCARHPTEPAHLIPRGLSDDLDGDPRAVVPLCRSCHRSYDEGELSLLEHLEPHWRAELAFAVERIGLLSTLRRVTNERTTEVA